MQEIFEVGDGMPPDQSGMPATTPPSPDDGDAQAVAEVDLLNEETEPAVALGPQAQGQDRPAGDHLDGSLAPEDLDLGPDATAAFDEASGGPPAESEGVRAEGPADDRVATPEASPSPSGPDGTDTDTPAAVASASPEVAAADTGKGSTDTDTSKLDYTPEPNPSSNQAEGSASGKLTAPRHRGKARGAKGPGPTAVHTDPGSAGQAGGEPTAESDSADLSTRRLKRGTAGQAAPEVNREGEIAELVDAIRAEQRKIDEGEGNAVASNIAIGNNLVRLRAVSKRDWAKRLKSLGISTRTASRLMKVVNDFEGDLGLIAADLLPKLPLDVNKLECLCRLDKEQLREVLEASDCRKATRKEVQGWVKAALGEVVPTQESGANDTIAAIERKFDLFADRLIRLKPDEADEALGARYRASLEAGLAKLQGTFEVS